MWKCDKVSLQPVFPQRTEFSQYYSHKLCRTLNLQLLRDRTFSAYSQLLLLLLDIYNLFLGLVEEGSSLTFSS